MKRATVWAQILAALAAVEWSAKAFCAEPESVRIATVDGVELRGHYHPARRDSSCVMLLHDLGEERHSGAWRRCADFLSDKGCAVLTFDFRGHGQSTWVEKDVFWSPRFGANRAQVRGKPRDDIRCTEFERSYWPVLVNDIAAAKSFLDRRNDLGDCNASNVFVIGRGQGATLGAVWLNAEFHRYRLVPSQFVGVAPRLDRQTEGASVLAAIWLALEPKLGGRAVNLTALLEATGRRQRVPTAFLYDTDDETAQRDAKALESRLRAGEKLPYTGAVPIAGLNAAGAIPDMAFAEIANYLEQIRDDNGQEWFERESRETLYVWRHPRTGRLSAANQQGASNLVYSTYESFIPR
jgi:pimeloyl-ACP methyl ester carboxylesterase